MFTIPILLLLLPAWCVPPISSSVAAQRPTQDARQMVVEYYRPKQAPVDRLVTVFREVAPITGPATYVTTFGESVLLTGEEAEVAGALELLKRMDAEWVREEATLAPLASLEYRVRYVSIDVLAGALDPYRRTIFVQGQGDQGPGAPNVSFLERPGLVVARDEPETIAEIEGLLKRIDVPQPQVRLTCYLLEGRTEPGDDRRVPEELTRDLAQLVPFTGFELLSFGLFRSDASAAVQMEETLPGGGYFQLDLRPETFEPSARALTFERCRFDLQRQGPKQMETKMFTTRARVSLDEYTVLGALGSEPVFVVLRVSLIEG